MNNETTDNIKKMKSFLGLLLVVLGLSVGLWVVIHVCSMISDPKSLSAFQGLISGPLESRLSGVEGEMTLVVTLEIIAYLIPLILLFIVVKVASVLIAGGVKLLDSEYQIMNKRLSALKDQISVKLDSFKESLNKYTSKHS